jgi:hypothetical protein
MWWLAAVVAVVAILGALVSHRSAFQWYLCLCAPCCCSRLPSPFPSVSHVWVDGKPLLVDRKLVTLSEEATVEASAHWAGVVRAAAAEAKAADAAAATAAVPPAE